MNRKEIEKAIERELEEWPGAAVSFVEGGKHPRAKLQFGGKFLAISFSGTPTSGRSIHHTLADVRRTLKKLGAERPKPTPSQDEDEAPYRKPNDGAAKREAPRGDPAPVQPSLADKLVDAGAASPEQAETAAAAREPATGKPLARGGRPILVGDAEPVTEAEEEEARIRDAAAAIVDGVYFDLEDKVYHAVEALGSGSISDLLVSPGTFWNGSWLDPDRPPLDEEATKAQVVGKAYHVARLESHRFASAYARKPSKDDFDPKTLLTSDAAIKAELKELGQTQAQSGEDIPERARRLLDCGFEGVILPLVMHEFMEALDGREPLDGNVWDDIVRDMERIKQQPDVARHLEGGQAEVSVFWTDDRGIRCKARFDYLKSSSWTDFKTYDNSRRKQVDQAIADAFRYNRYYVQATHYRDAVEAIRDGLAGVEGEATQEQRLLIDDIVARKAPLECWYIFQEKGGAPNLFARRFQFTALDSMSREYEVEAFAKPELADDVRDALASSTMIARRGRVEVARAKDVFQLYSEVYPRGEPWAPLEPVGVIGDLDFNSYWLEGKA